MIFGWNALNNFVNPAVAAPPELATPLSEEVAELPDDQAGETFQKKALNIIAAEWRTKRDHSAVTLTSSHIRVLFHSSLLFAAVAECEASDFRYMPTLEELSQRNLLWREQVVGMWKYLEWVPKAADTLQLFGDLEVLYREIRYVPVVYYPYLLIFSCCRLNNFYILN